MKPRGVSPSGYFIPVEDDCPVRAEASGRVSRFDGARLTDMKILVVEDNESFSLMLCSALREAGFEVASALSGKEGIKSALFFLPDLILMDYQLGDMTGYDAAIAIKCMRATASTPFILLSSLADDPLLTAAFKKMPSCRGALVKSRPFSEIVDFVHAVLRRTARRSAE